MYFLISFYIYVLSSIFYAHGGLLLTEYVEGSGYNKALELTNVGQDTIDLSTVHIDLFNNGRSIAQGASQSIKLLGTLAPQQSHVVAHYKAAADLVARADLLTNLSFNGNDAIVIYVNDDIVDSFGQVGIDPGEFWQQNQVRSKNQTLRRRSDVIQGRQDPQNVFNIGEQWLAFEKDIFHGLGCKGKTGCVNEVPQSACVSKNRVSIAQIQGASERSPLLPTDSDISPVEYTTQGVVTAIISNLNKGFFIQETPQFESVSSGLFIYTPLNVPHGLNVGDEVCVTGRVQEYYGFTQMVLDSLHNSGATGRQVVVLPLELDPKKNLNAQLEAYEGMIVTLNKAQSNLVITRTFGYDYENRRNNMLLSLGSPLLIPTHVFPALTPQFRSLKKLNSQQQLWLETDSFAKSGKIPWFPDFHPETGYLRVGDAINGLEGVISRDHNNWQLIATSQIATDQIDHQVRLEKPPLRESGDLKVATFNVYNFFTSPFTGVDNPTGKNRGATSFEDYTLQRQKLVSALKALDADIIGLMELENNGFDEGASLQVLVKDLNDTFSDSAQHYQLIKVLDSPWVGTDAITNGLIYRSARVQPLGEAQVLDLPYQKVTTAGKRFLQKQRPALIQTFQIPTHHQQLTVAVNHLKSKGSGCYEDYPDEMKDATLDGQGRCNELRVSAAVILGEHFASRDEPVLLIGDFNAYPKEDPLLVLTDRIHETQGRRIVTSAYTYLDQLPLYQEAKIVNKGYPFVDIFAYGEDKHSTYSFNGMQGRLDTILANESATKYIVDKTVWSINAAESPLFGYSRKYSGSLAKQADAYRSSDHDPVVVVFDYSQHNIPAVQFRESVIRVHPDAEKIQVWMERSPENVSKSLHINLELVHGERTFYQTDLIWPAHDINARRIEIPNPGQEAQLKMIIKNDETMLLQSVTSAIEIDPQVVSLISMREPVIEIQEGYTRVMVPVMRAGNVSKSVTAEIELTTSTASPFWNYLPWYRRKVKWDAWESNEKNFTFWLMHDWFGAKDHLFQAKLKPKIGIEIGEYPQTMIYVKNVDRRWFWLPIFKMEMLY